MAGLAYLARRSRHPAYLLRPGHLHQVNRDGEQYYGRCGAHRPGHDPTGARDYGKRIGLTMSAVTVSSVIPPPMTTSTSVTADSFV
ncbi:hypothetical protein GCM10023192_20900 [Amycolatopsis samaneae]